MGSRSFRLRERLREPRGPGLRLTGVENGLRWVEVGVLARFRVAGAGGFATGGVSL